MKNLLPKLNLPEHLLWVTTAVATLLLLLLIGYTLWQMQASKRGERRDARIRKEWNDVLAALMLEEQVPEQGFVLPPALLQQTANRQVRAVLAAELARTRQSLRGQMDQVVVAIYEQLELWDVTARLIYSRKWHRIAAGIQQATALHQRRFFKVIFKHVNHTNEWIRSEAQLGMIRLFGPRGLRFLAGLQYPLSEWQQFNMLHELQLQPTEPPANAEQWLQSANDTVVVFTIRICQLYQQFQLADQITRLLDHPSAAVRSAAFSCLHQWGFDGLQEAMQAEPLSTYPKFEIAAA